VYADNNTIWWNPPAEIMSIDDLNDFKFDCDHIRQQRKFLQTQLSNISRYQSSSTERAIIYKLLAQMDLDCLPPQPVAHSSCEHTREDSHVGSATSTTCYSKEDPNMAKPTGAPIIDRWEPVLDRR
jgi:hypothetical protein